MCLYDFSPVVYGYYSYGPLGSPIYMVLRSKWDFVRDICFSTMEFEDF